MERFRSSIDAFELWLATSLKDQAGHPRLLDALGDAVLGGKRFRAVLTFAAAGAAGIPERRAYPLAGAIEMIHAYSLVHDDLPALDNADLRRGHPTLHRRHGEALAILAGDALLTDAFGLICRLEAEPQATLAAIRDLARAAGTPGMVSGQVADMLDLPQATTIEAVRAVHRGKTGALIEWSLLTPLTLWAPALLETVRPFAEHLGVLFQVRDDLLDLDPNAAQDKDRNADGAKSTYARLLGIAGAQAHANEHLDICLAAAAKLPQPHADVFAELAAWTVGRLQ